jgi:hypothetical protein
METFTVAQVIETTAQGSAAFSVNERGEGVALETADPAAFSQLVTELLGPAITCVSSSAPELKHLRVIHSIPPLGHSPQTSRLNPSIHEFLGPDFDYGGAFVVASTPLAEAAFAA